ncbi:XRE family transcriptional regulator [Aurantimonas sp. Leaf443]|uniref:helix-turn-helix domain-containing protein n=1 Tax=Aurantimonas sp. Leaf443 TaxID=1736378 RepID=UPI0006F272B5|nr:XRE family transcriptional regulator [Aurantimonas sp. Leaf443]KQT87139.1 hypothetical protein ASG48_17415 [Aurantimonas sp. Leaf443]
MSDPTQHQGGRSLSGLTTLDDWLDEEGTREDVAVLAVKKVIAAQLVVQMREQNITKAELARRMHTSRSQIDRVLDPSSDVNVGTLSRAAGIVGRKVRLELI